MHDKLVKRLRESKNEQCYIGCFGNCGDCKIDAELEQAANAIEELSKPRWIPVTERLPEEYENVLLLSMSGEIISGYYDSEYKSYCDMSGFRKLCTHWMPLPQPPKEET